MDKQVIEDIKKHEQEVNSWWSRDVNVSITSLEDEQLFATILGQMIVDCFSDSRAEELFKSKDKVKTFVFGAALSRPILCAYMYAKENKTMENAKDVKIG